ncbi:MAG: ornithine cyclodeaminase family protein [Phototrophicales bacterium]|nr:MAG: ornithine cyclodeaminase family protein [Phototrophicales bacterium]
MQLSTPRIFSREEIEQVIQRSEVLTAIEAGFVLYSMGEVQTPSTTHLQFENPDGEVHLKAGYIVGEPYYVINVVSGFFNNYATYGLPNNDGLMLLHRRETGELVAILLDHGLLTDIRTAAAGAIAAKYLAPRHVTAIGIVGTGTQARLQLAWLSEVIDCTEVVVWGRSEERLAQYVEDMGDQYHITTTLEMSYLTERCNLIVTTTASKAPLLFAEQIQPGTHITAIGADIAGKQELDPRILYSADLVVADSINQCLEFGELSNASEMLLRVTELGSVIENPYLQRQNDNQITVADLTGIAAQDAKIATLVYRRLLERE